MPVYRNASNSTLVISDIQNPAYLNPGDVVIVSDTEAEVSKQIASALSSGQLVLESVQPKAEGIDIITAQEVPLIDISTLSGSITSLQHGPQPGGDLHNVATVTQNGFMSASDKSTLDLLSATGLVKYEWILSGNVITDNGVDGIRMVDVDLEIISVWVVLLQAGKNGQTVIDINRGSSGLTVPGQVNNINLSSIYTTQDNRPTVAANNNKNAVVLAALPNVTTLSRGDILTMDIDQAPGGTPKAKDLTVTIFARPV